MLPHGTGSKEIRLQPKVRGSGVMEREKRKGKRVPGVVVDGTKRCATPSPRGARAVWRPRSRGAVYEHAWRSPRQG